MGVDWGLFGNGLDLFFGRWFGVYGNCLGLFCDCVVGLCLGWLGMGCVKTKTQQQLQQNSTPHSGA